MPPTFYIPSRGRLAMFADRMTLPLMQLVAPRGESPQLTHRWNNLHLERSAVDHLDRAMMLAFSGDPSAVVRNNFWDLRFHLGGWSRYVVLEPDYDGTWYVGWVWNAGAGASQIPISRHVRMLIGPSDTEFFGVTTSGRQIKLREVGRGRIGDRSSFQTIPLH